jgi:hypothetical protein
MYFFTVFLDIPVCSEISSLLLPWVYSCNKCLILLMLMVVFAIFCLIWLLPNLDILWRLHSMNLFFVSGGQFKPVKGGQFKPVKGGQFHRILHLTQNRCWR